MTIAIPAEEKGLDSAICQSFGRAPYYCIYDTKSESSRFIDNSAKDAPRGAGIEAAQLLVDQKVDALITFRLGENAAKVLQASDITLLKALNLCVADNIAQYIENKLAPLNDIHPGHHNG